MATIHSFLRKEHEDVFNAADTVQYGPSTCNNVFQVTVLKGSILHLPWLVSPLRPVRDIRRQ